MLSFSAQPDLIINRKVDNKKVSYTFHSLPPRPWHSVQSILNVATVDGTAESKWSFQLPLDNTRRSQAERRTVLVSLANQGVSDLEQLPRDTIRIKTDPGGALRDSRVLFKFQSEHCSRPSTYILESVLNL